MASNFDNLEKDAFRFGAGVPVGTKWRQLSDEQRQGFDSYMRTKVRQNPAAYANDTRANKYLKDYDQRTFDAMRQQELNDSVNPGSMWDDFGTSGMGIGEPLVDEGEDNTDKEERRENDSNNEPDDEPEEKDSDSDNDSEESQEEQPEEGGEPGIGEDASAPKSKTPGEGPAKEIPKTVPGLGDGAKAAGNAAKVAEAGEGATAVAGAGATAAAGAGETAAVAATAGAAAPEFLIVLIVLGVIFLVLIALWGLFAQNPGGEDENLTVPANILEYCTANYEKYDSQSELKQIYGSSESVVSAQLKSIDFPTTVGKITVHEKAAPCFEAVARELISSGSTYRIVSGGTFNWRPNVNSPSNLSLHSFGIAIDMNTSANCNNCGLPPNCTTDMPPDFVAIWKKYGFRWGGDYRSTCDAMHYEWMGGALGIAIPSFDDAGNTIGGTTTSGVVFQPSHQTDTFGGLEASRANKIADYALAALSSSSKKKVSSWPNQTNLSYWNSGSNACTGSTASGTGYFWELTESNKISPKVFVGIHLNGGTDGKSVQGYYHEGEGENRAFAADLAAEIDKATTLSAVTPGKDNLGRDCGSAGTRYISSDGKNGFYSIDAGVNKAKYRVILEIGDNEKNQAFWTEANMKLVGEAIARVSTIYANK